MRQIISFLLRIAYGARDFLERKLYTDRVSGLYGVYFAGEEWKHIGKTRVQYESHLMSDPDIIIGSQVEHIHEEWSGEVIGLIFDEDGAVESISVWIEDGDVVDDPIGYWDHIESELLPDNIIEATNRFMKKK
jgi:hypothetical protein